MEHTESTTALPTDSMEQTPYEANIVLAIQEISDILWNPKVH
jgi:hypothetical protein